MYGMEWLHYTYIHFFEDAMHYKLTKAEKKMDKLKCLHVKDSENSASDKRLLLTKEGS